MALPATKFIYLNTPKFNINWPVVGTSYLVPLDGKETFLSVAGTGR